LENETKTKSKDGVKNTFLPLLLGCIEQDGDSISKIAKTLGKTKQALNYHLSKQKKAGLIRTIQKYPYSIYVLTDLGKRVKKILIQSEGVTNLWRCHALIVGYPILSYGDYMFEDTKNRKIIQMVNWKYAREQMGEYIINVQETGLLKIYCPERYSASPDEEFGRMYADVERVAQHYCNKYNMSMERMRVIRVGHKELQDSNQLAKIFGKVKTKDFWVDNSTGTDNLEEKQGTNQIESLLDLPNQMRDIVPIINALPPLIKQVIENDARFSQNLVTHLEVLKKIGDGIDKLSMVMEEIRNDIKKRG